MGQASLIVTLVATTTLSLVAFQNCAEPFQQDQASSLGASISDLDNPYKVGVDTVAYMSCSHQAANANTERHFTFKVGAYGSESGLELTDGFKGLVGGRIQLEQVKVIRNAPVSQGRRVIAYLGHGTSYSSLYKGSGFDENEDYALLSPDLSNEAVAKNVVGSLAGKVRHFPGVSGFLGKIEGQFNFDFSESGDLQMKNALQQDYRLVVGFHNSAQTNAPSLIGENGVGIEGSKMNLGFTRGHRSFATSDADNAGSFSFQNFTQGPSRVLSSVIERDGKTNANMGTWNCSQSMKFMIVRPEDNRNVVLCGAKKNGSNVLDMTLGIDEDPTNMNATINFVPSSRGLNMSREALYKLVRKVLPADQWVVDFNRQCVVPKASADQCYSDHPRIGSKPIDYTGLSANCDSNTVADGSDTNSARICPHYVSICIKE